MAKQGVWGERNWIYYPILNKRVSCATCKHYCHEDRSCIATSVIPYIAGFDFWKNCSTFDLSPEYLDSKHMDQVKKWKGEAFFNQTKEDKRKFKGHDYKKESGKEIRDGKSDQETLRYTPANVHNHPVQFTDRVIRSLWVNHGIELQKIKGITDEKKTFYFVKGQMMLFIIEPVRILNKYSTHRWSAFKNKVECDIELLKAYDTENKYMKGIILPLVHNTKNESYAEVYISKKGNILEGFRLFEMDDSDEINLVNSIEQEKIWSNEKIRNLKIFK